MTQALSDISAETKLKAANAFAKAFETWVPQTMHLILHINTPDAETLDAVILVLDKFAWESGEDVYSWYAYERKLDNYTEPIPMLGLAIIRFLTRPAG